MYYFSFLFLLLSPLFLMAETAGRVLVSVAPYKKFVEKIAENTIEVQLMVPTGASSHTYEPTPRQMISAAQAVLWFRIGEPFEERAIQSLRSHQPLLEIVDLRQGVHLIDHDPSKGCSCCPGCVDLHFWLSAREAQVQVRTIYEALVKKFPQYKALYETNFLKTLEELKQLDDAIRVLLEPLTNRNILVSHPAYAYFCRDYRLKQFSIEVEGKDPTPQQLTKLLQLAKQQPFATIFIQSQYNNKAAKLVADMLHARLVNLDPYGEDYFTCMMEIAQAFAKKDHSS